VNICAQGFLEVKLICLVESNSADALWMPAGAELGSKGLDSKLNRGGLACASTCGKKAGTVGAEFSYKGLLFSSG
jgi:hypothetical protein